MIEANQTGYRDCSVHGVFTYYTKIPVGRRSVSQINACSLSKSWAGRVIRAFIYGIFRCYSKKRVIYPRTYFIRFENRCSESKPESCCSLIVSYFFKSIFLKTGTYFTFSKLLLF